MTIRQSNSGTPTPISKQSFQFVAKNQANKAAATESNGFVKGYDVSRFSQMPSSGQATPGAQLLRQGVLNTSKVDSFESKAFSQTPPRGTVNQRTREESIQPTQKQGMWSALQDWFWDTFFEEVETSERPVGIAQISKQVFQNANPGQPSVFFNAPLVRDYKFTAQTSQQSRS